MPTAFAVNKIVPRLRSKPLLFKNGKKVPKDTIVLHATAGASAKSSISHLRNVGLSYDYVIERDGTIFQLVNNDRRALHAGESVGPHGSDVNGYAFGISLANFQGFKGKMEGYTDVQLEALEWLVGEIVKGYGIKYMTTHRIISPGRRADPKGIDLLEFCKKFPGVTPWRKNKSQDWRGPEVPVIWVSIAVVIVLIALALIVVCGAGRYDKIRPRSDDIFAATPSHTPLSLDELRCGNPDCEMRILPDGNPQCIPCIEILEDRGD